MLTRYRKRKMFSPRSSMLPSPCASSVCPLRSRIWWPLINRSYPVFRLLALWWVHRHLSLQKRASARFLVSPRPPPSAQEQRAAVVTVLERGAARDHLRCVINKRRVSEWRAYTSYDRPLGTIPPEMECLAEVLRRPETPRQGAVQCRRRHIAAIEVAARRPAAETIAHSIIRC